MQSTTVRVNAATHRALESLAQVTGSSIQGVLGEAVEAYRRKVFLERNNRAYADLKRDPKAWAELGAELAAWDGTVEDGL